ncbi:MAG: vWA domain-containing protein, partial [bacterium]
MQNLFSYLLIAFQQPLWLVCLPLAGLPIWLFWLQPVKFRPVPAGWGIKPDYFISRTISLRKWRAILAALSLFSMIMALARPIIPKVAFLEMMPMGHHFAIIIDCSGSMAQIDPAQSNSRLSRLSKAIRHEMQSHPSDRFTIIRVAGYADRIGPPAASPDFLDALLEQ